MAPHSNTPVWKIPWTEEPGGLQSMGLRRVGHDWSDLTFTFYSHALEKEMAPHSSVLAWRIPGTAEPGGLPSMGSHRVGHDWSDLEAAAVAFTIYFPEYVFLASIQKYSAYMVLAVANFAGIFGGRCIGIVWIWHILQLLFHGNYRLSLVPDKACACLVASVMSDSLRPHGPHLLRLLCSCDLPSKNTWNLSKPGIKLLSSVFPALQANCLPLSHHGSPTPTLAVC